MPSSSTGRRRSVAVLGAALVCVLAPSSRALAHQEAHAPAAVPVRLKPDTTTKAGHIVEPPNAPSVGSMFREVPVDLWRFVSLDTAAVLAAGGGAAALAHIWDDDFVAELQVNPQLNDAFEPGSKYGAFGIMLGGSVLVYGVGRMSGHRHLAVTGADLVRGQIVAQLWVQALKYVVQRERPDGSNDVSLPSGHAAGGFAAAAVLARHYGWKAAIPAYIGAGYIAAARVHDNKHYLSDVTFGAAMGIAGARTVMLKAGRYGVRLAPAPALGGIALNVTLVGVRSVRLQADSGTEW